MIFCFDDFELDNQLYELRRDGVPVHLEPQVFGVLLALVSNRDRVMTKDELLELVWGDRFISDAALNSRVMAARRAVSDDGRQQRLIRTVHGRGFRFIGEVSESGSPTVATTPQHSRSSPSPYELSRPQQTLQYCMTTTGIRLAFATMGNGTPVVKPPNWLTHLGLELNSPVWRHWWEDLCAHHLLLRFDQRGSGLSQRNSGEPSFDAWLEDLETVVGAAGLDRFALLGIFQGGAVAIEYAVRHPDRVSHLILCGAYARGWVHRGQSLEEHEAIATLAREGWGRESPAYRQMLTEMFMPDASPDQMTWFNELQRVSISPDYVASIRRTGGNIDVSHRLQEISTPTLVLHSRGDLAVPFSEGQLIASLIPGARFVPLESRNHLVLKDEPAARMLIAEVENFLDAPV